MTIQTLLADDETLACEKLRQASSRGEAPTEVKGETSSASRAHKLVGTSSPQRLQSALLRARGQTGWDARKANPESADASGSGSYSSRILCKSRGRILFLPVSDIRWISAEENYVRLWTDTETHLLRETMTSIEQRLDPKSFLRVHRSAIVNLSYVKEVRTEARGDFMVHLINGQKLAMSRSYHARISELLSHV